MNRERRAERKPDLKERVKMGKGAVGMGRGRGRRNARDVSRDRLTLKTRESSLKLKGGNKRNTTISNRKMLRSKRVTGHKDSSKSNVIVPDNPSTSGQKLLLTVKRVRVRNLKKLNTKARTEVKNNLMIFILS